MEKTPAKSTTKRSWQRPRFTIGVLLLFTSLCALPLGFVAYRRSHNEARKSAFDLLSQKGFSFVPAGINSRLPIGSFELWRRSLLKEDLVPPVREVRIDDSLHGGAPATDADLRLVALFPEITELRIQNAREVSDAGLEVVVNLPRLNGLYVDYAPRVSSRVLERLPLVEVLVLRVDFQREHVSALARQTKLVMLHLYNAPLTDEDLAFLGECRQIDHLSLVGLPIDGSCLAKIDENAPLHFLTLSGAPITDRYATELHRFPRLVRLDLAWTAIEGEFLPAPSKWPMLQELILQGARFSDPGKAKLARFGALAMATYPSNWSALDLWRYDPGPAPAMPTLNLLYADQAKANSIAVASFYPPNVQPPAIDHCPTDLMGPVIQLLEMAEAENEEFKRKAAED
jgi:hypothetical protein